MYKTIYELHDVPVAYTFNEESPELYAQYSDAIVMEMNRQLEENIVLADYLSEGRKLFLKKEEMPKMSLK